MNSKLLIWLLTPPLARLFAKPKTFRLDSKDLSDMPVTDEEVVTKLRQLLREVDMETTTGCLASLVHLSAWRGR